MSSSSGQYNGGCSPFSHNDIAGSTNTLVLKPTTHIPQKQRSSSINSITSNHSAMNTSNISANNTRSMSIVSLDSPRNSIASIDDSMVKITRKSSTGSLTSLNNVSSQSPIDYIISHRVGSSSRGGAILLSDEEPDLEHSIPTTKAMLKASLKHSFEKISTRQVLNLKQDYKFKFDKIIPYSGNDKRDYQDNTPSPLSTTTSDSNKNVKKKEIKNDAKAISPIRALVEKNTSKLLKKVKQTGTIPQSSILKKKSIFSKDLQLELMNVNANYSSNDLVQAKFVQSHTPTKSSNNQIDSVNLCEKNKMIHKLNQKWNKSTNGVTTTEPLKSRKRSRSLSSDYEDINDITA